MLYYQKELLLYSIKLFLKKSTVVIEKKTDAIKITLKTFAFIDSFLSKLACTCASTSKILNSPGLQMPCLR